MAVVGVDLGSQSTKAVILQGNEILGGVRFACPFSFDVVWEDKASRPRVEADGVDPSRVERLFTVDDDGGFRFETGCVLAADGWHDAAFGAPSDPESTRAALRQLAEGAPGFDASQFEWAFARALRWTMM